MSEDFPLPPANILPEGISNVGLEDEMRRSYLDYAMSVIVSRALPDVRDGLKPVHRRILFAMKEANNDYNRPYRKSARLVGEVIGKFHPHGEAAVYDAMVRMAQDFSMRAPLIDGQGNYGSMDGDPPAAMRYTETRLSKLAHSLLEDIDQGTVAFRPNYDESLEEPLVLPARFPNLLVNGSGGIAVGMATNIPPHNLGEVIDACILLIDDPLTSDEDLLAVMPAPDFPTGALILGRGGAQNAFRTGRGSIIMRGRTHVEEIRKDRQAIIISEIPFQVNKARLVERIAETVHEKIIEGIGDLRDESDRDGVRVVIELKRDATPEVVLNQLFRHTALQTSFSVNQLALHQGIPQLMSTRQVLLAFIEFREETILRRTRFDLTKAQERAHILIGLCVAVANIDEVIVLIRQAPDPAIARQHLMERFWAAESIAPFIKLITHEGDHYQEGVYRLTELQARAILDLRLHRLTGLERDKLTNELEQIADEIKECLKILNDRPYRLGILKTELLAVRTHFATPRRSEIVESGFDQDDEDLIEREDMVITVSHGGYIKRVPIDTYRAQHRGGKGRVGMSTRDEDCVQEVFVANTHAPVFFFSTTGQVYCLKGYKLPLGSAQSRGKAMVNLLPLEAGETISTVLVLPEDRLSWRDHEIVFVTSKGNCRRNKLSDFENIRARGMMAIRLDEGETLIAVRLCGPDQDVFLATRLGRSIRFPAQAVRVFAGRASNGVRAIRLAPQDEVVSACILNGMTYTMEERQAYLKETTRLARLHGSTIEEATLEEEEEEEGESLSLAPELFERMRKEDQTLLTVTSKGFGKRTSSYAYRQTNRGGIGISNMTLTSKNGEVVTSQPVIETDHVMLVTNQGQILRCGVHEIRITGRNSQGVILFRVAPEEEVVSVAVLAPEEAPEEGENSPLPTVSPRENLQEDTLDS